MNHQARKTLNFLMMKWATFIVIFSLMIVAFIGQITSIEQAFLSGLMLLIYGLCAKEIKDKFNKKRGEKK